MSKLNVLTRALHEFRQRCTKRWTSMDNDTRWMTAGAIVCLAAYFGYQVVIMATREHELPVNLETPARMDTGIPNGWSLVPLGQIVNYVALDAAVEGYALVDVFTLDPKGRPTDTALLTDARLIRLPNDSTQFAVMVPYALVAKTAQAQSVFITLKNPKHSRQTMEGQKRSSRITIGGSK